MVLPNLPVEIQFIILFFAFKQDLPSSPQDVNPFLLSSALPLLRVCKAYYQYCLPLLYRRLVICRPNHWTGIFHRQTGCLNHPILGPTRIGWVKELVFTIIPFPLVLDSTEGPTQNADMNDLLPFKFPSLDSVERIVYVPPTPSEIEQAVQDLKANIQQYTDVHTAPFRKTIACLPLDAFEPALLEVQQAMFNAVGASLALVHPAKLNELGRSFENINRVILETQLREGCLDFFHHENKLSMVNRLLGRVTLRLHFPEVGNGRSLTNIRDVLFDYLGEPTVEDTVLVNFPRSLRIAYKQHLSSEATILRRYHDVAPGEMPKVASPHKNVSWEST
ncbi:hypothetical protein [Phaffia rhodozyma]|uniref:F-box domain-containing protein n=1 Tax=Phaffia rhodozyma TaxID=264483 RepID=A0A0F7SPU0_PHARH|nr:hypothetical protein [Phaffia rhodozyma]